MADMPRRPTESRDRPTRQQPLVAAAGADVLGAWPRRSADPVGLPGAVAVFPPSLRRHAQV